MFVKASKKWVTITKTLNYYATNATKCIASVKSFMKQAPGANPKKTFSRKYAHSSL